MHATGRFRPSFIHKVPNTSLSPFSPTLKRARSFFECDLESARLCVSVCVRARTCRTCTGDVQSVTYREVHVGTRTCVRVCVIVSV